MRIHVSRRAAGRVATLSVVLILLVGASLAYRFLFNRPGEKAIQLIPADAYVVVTLDTNPSPAQAPLFSRIKSALEREGLTQKLESAISDAVQKSPVVSQVRPYTSTSFAFAMLSPGNGKSGMEAEPVVLISAKDPDKVQETLEKNGAKHQMNGLTLYKFASDQTYAAVLGSYLVVSPKPGDIARIEAVRSGGARSVASLLEYQQARAALPEDANLMVFLSPSAMKEIDKETNPSGRKTPWASSQWMALSATVRDAGVAFDYRMPMDQSRDAALRAMASVAPLDLGVLNRLPSGAYGLFALSQPSRYWESVEGTMGAAPNGARELAEGVAEFEKQTGMSVQKDVLPGLQGNVWLVAYPDTRGADKGVDGLILIDDANGADPAALAEKVRLFAERATSENGTPRIAFRSEERGSNKVWSLDDRSARELRAGVADAAASSGEMLGSPATGPGASPPIMTGAGIDTPGGSVQLDFEGLSVRGPATLENNKPTPADSMEYSARVDSEGPSAVAESSRDAFPARRQSSPEASRFAENKTVVYAQVGKAVLIASSQEMLDRALAAYAGQGGTLAEDASFGNMKSALPPGSQNALMVDLGAIMEALRPVFEKGMKGSDSAITVDDIVNLFGKSAGLVAAGKYDGQTAIGTLFLPIDYDRGLKSLGSLLRQFDPPAGPPRVSWIRQAPAAAAMVSGVPLRVAAR